MKQPGTFRKISGTNLIELLAALGVFSLLCAFATMLLSQSVRVWSGANSKEDAGMQLLKGRRALLRDLSQARARPDPDTGEQCLNYIKAPQVLGGGQALWFLSAERADGQGFALDRDGYPYWQRNILYYLAIPSDHDALYGGPCQPSSNPDGNDCCPHKVLIRVVIDADKKTEPLPDLPADVPDDSSPEELLSPDKIEGYLLAPKGLDVSKLMALPKVQSVQVLAPTLLWFQVQLMGTTLEDGIQVDLRAVALREANSRSGGLGASSLLDDPLTQQSLFTVITKN